MKKENKQNNDFSNSMALFPLMVMFMAFSGNKDDETLKGIEKQLDEIKWLLTNKK